MYLVHRKSKRKKKGHSDQAAFYFEGLNSQGYKIYLVTMLPWLLFSKAFCDTSQRYTFITPGPYSHLRRQFIILELQKDFFTLVHPFPVEQGWISCYPGGPPGQRAQFTQHNSHLQTQPALNRVFKVSFWTFQTNAGSRWFLYLPIFLSGQFSLWPAPDFNEKHKVCTFSLHSSIRSRDQV